MSDQVTSSRSVQPEGGEIQPPIESLVEHGLIEAAAPPGVYRGASVSACADLSHPAAAAWTGGGGLASLIRTCDLANP